MTEQDEKTLKSWTTAIARVKQAIESDAPTEQ